MRWVLLLAAVFGLWRPELLIAGAVTWVLWVPGWRIYSRIRFGKDS